MPALPKTDATPRCGGVARKTEPPGATTELIQTELIQKREKAEGVSGRCARAWV